MTTVDLLERIRSGILILMEQQQIPTTGFEARRILTQAHQNNGGGGAKSINEMIPLNRYSFFQELEKKMLPPMQLTI